MRLTPGPRHPIVSTHPESSRNSLFLGRRPRHYVNGLAREEFAKFVREDTARWGDIIKQAGISVE